MTERRNEPRFAVGKSARVTLLDEAAQAPSSPRESPANEIMGTIADVSERGMRLLLDRPLPIDAAVRIDLDDVMGLAEVRYCVSTGAGYGVGIELQHSLLNLAGLVEAREDVSETAPAVDPLSNAG
jgi:hypothetical protein